MHAYYNTYLQNYFKKNIIVIVRRTRKDKF